MNYGNFKKYVLAYIKRTAAHMTVDGQDCLGVAINAARKFSERIVDFENNRVRGQIVINLANGTDVSAVTTLAGGALAVKTIKAATVDYDDQTTLPLDLIARADHLNRVKRRLDVTLRDETQRSIGDRVLTPALSLVRFGSLLYLSPNTAQSFGSTEGATTVTVGLDVIKWMPDYSADGDTDFLLEHCYDYLTLRTVQMLNAFLKEDVRIPVNQVLLDHAWKSVRIWDTKLLDGATDISTTLD